MRWDLGDNWIILHLPVSSHQMAIPQTVIGKLTSRTNEARTKVGVGFLPSHELMIEIAIKDLIHERVPVKNKALKHQQDEDMECKGKDTGSPEGWSELNCLTW